MQTCLQQVSPVRLALVLLGVVLEHTRPGEQRIIVVDHMRRLKALTMYQARSLLSCAVSGCKSNAQVRKQRQEWGDSLHGSYLSEPGSCRIHVGWCGPRGVLAGDSCETRKLSWQLEDTSQCNACFRSVYKVALGMEETGNCSREDMSCLQITPGVSVHHVHSGVSRPLQQLCCSGGQRPQLDSACAAVAGPHFIQVSHSAGQVNAVCRTQVAWADSGTLLGPSHPHHPWDKQQTRQSANGLPAALCLMAHKCLSACNLHCSIYTDSSPVSKYKLKSCSTPHILTQREGLLSDNS